MERRLWNDDSATGSRRLCDWHQGKCESSIKIFHLKFFELAIPRSQAFQIPNSALASLSNPELRTSHVISLGKVWPKARVVHRRRARRLRLRLSQHQSRWDPKGRRQIRRDGAWVRREQSRGSWDPPAHFREAQTRRYSGYWANNHFRHVRGAKMRMPRCSERKAQQLSRTRRAGPPEWRHPICSCSGQDI